MSSLKELALESFISFLVSNSSAGPARDRVQPCPQGAPMEQSQREAGVLPGGSGP